MPEKRTPDELRIDLADLVAELLDPIDHTEPYEWRPEGRAHGEQRKHRTRHPPLLLQLATATTPGGAGDNGHRHVDSQPSANLDAIDRLKAIDTAVNDWLRHAGARRRWTKLPVRLRRLVGIPWADDDLRHLVADAKRWVVWARVTTGWDSPAFKPHNRCPYCQKYDGLRIRIDQLIACCIECGTTWDSASIGLLAEMIRLVTCDTMLLPVIKAA